MPPSLGGAVLPFALGSAVAVGACYYYSLLRKSRDEAADAKAVDDLPEDFIPTAPMPSRSVSAPPSVGFRPLPPPAEAVSTKNDEEEELIEDDGSDIGIDFDKLLSLEHMREFDAVCAQELQRVNMPRKQWKVSGHCFFLNLHSTYFLSNVFISPFK